MTVKLFKLLVFLLLILALESLVTSLVIFPIVFIYKYGTPHALGYDYFLYAPIFFMIYKCGLELWLFYVVAIIKSRNSVSKTLSFKGLVFARVVALAFVEFVLILASFDNPDVFLVFAIMYIPSVYISFKLINKFLMIGVARLSN